MFQDRFSSANNQRSHIRQRYSMFNLSSQMSSTLNERNFGIDSKY
jgi:hypothetical protein